jgi:hypothetical protein
LAAGDADALKVSWVCWHECYQSAVVSLGPDAVDEGGNCQQRFQGSNPTEPPDAAGSFTMQMTSADPVVGASIGVS